VHLLAPHIFVCHNDVVELFNLSVVVFSSIGARHEHGC
jgi:hypothetical protein